MAGGTPAWAAPLIPLLAILLLAGSGALGTPPQFAETIDGLRDSLSHLLASSPTPGVGVALVDRKGVIWIGGVGLADVASGRPVTGETLFRVASLAKSVTAVAAMQLVEQGRLSLDARMQDLAPEVDLENPWERSNPIRLAHLLEHTAGLDDSHFNEEWDDSPYPRPLRELLAVNPAARRARWPPGTRMSYSNEDYLVVGYVLERVTGRTYEEVVRAGIFAPLGMKTARFWRTPGTESLLATGYRDGRPIPDEEQMIRPAVNLIASPRDLAGYLSFWLARGGPGAPTLLTAGSIERIEATRTLPYPGPDQRYGLGNDADQLDGYVGRGHTGIYDGFIASFRYFPREGVGWALLFNSADAGTRSAVEREVLHFLMRGRPAAVLPIRPVAADQLRQLAGSYRLASPSIEAFAFLTAIDFLDIEDEDGALFERPFRQRGLFQRLAHEPRRELLPVGSGAFRHPGEGVSSRLFLQALHGPAALVTPDGYLEKIDPDVARLKRDLFFAAIFALLSAPALALASALRRVLRKRGFPPRLSVRLFPLLASLSFFSLYLLLSRSPQRWGRVNATTISACVLTWTFALLSLAAVYSSIRAPAQLVGRWVKLHSLIVAAAACGLATFFWRAHWIGIRLWRW